MQDKAQLISIIKNFGITLPIESYDDNEFYWRLTRGYLTKMYTGCPPFTAFLDSHTSYLPASKVTYKDRWRYYCDGRTTSNICAVCGKFIKDIRREHCSAKCRQTGHRLAPGTKESRLIEKLAKLRPDYVLTAYGEPSSSFRHSCGLVFEVGNGALTGFKPDGVYFKASCPCTHKKTMVVTLATLKARYTDYDTVWTPVAYNGNKKTAIFRHKDCGHKAELRYDYAHVLQRCPTCFPNVFDTHSMTEEEYIAQLKELKPDFELVGRYTDSRTRTTYLHLDCDQTFKTEPCTMRRVEFRCPACAPKTSGSFNVVVRQGRTFSLRGMEPIALDWILSHTNVKVGDILCDADRTLPIVYYTDPNGVEVKKYLPDFYLPSKNILVEVKSLQTLGLRHTYYYLDPVDLWYRNCAKAQACLALGYRFVLMVFSGKRHRIRLPKDWYLYSHEDIIAEFTRRYPRLRECNLPATLPFGT